MKRIALITICILTAAGAQRGRNDLRRAEEILTQGGTMAWARHVTGQWPDDLTTWDEFKSVATIPGTGEDEVWVVVDRTINEIEYKFIEQLQPQDFGDQDDAWFVDAGIGDVNSYGIPETPETGTGGTYTYTYINQLATVWGIPINDTTLLNLDVSGVAVNRGGGTVGLPYASNPFVSGEVIRITGSTNYTGTHTLTAGTTTSELQFTDTFNAETFVGTETVLKEIAGLDTGAGRMAGDPDGNLYVAHTLNTDADPDNYYVTKIEPDGTFVFDYEFLDFNWSASENPRIALGVHVSSDGRYLYIWLQLTIVSPSGFMTKFDLSDGSTEWISVGTLWGSFDSAIDAYGNAYGTFKSGGIAKYDADTGAITRFPDMEGPYVVHVDDTMGLLINAGVLNGGSNLWVRALDGSAADEIGLGAGTIGTTHLATDGEYIYAVTGGVLYKVAWNGSSLSIDSQTGALGIGQGLYIDLYDNLVVVNQTGSGTEDDVLYFFDKELNAISNTTGMYTSMLFSWAAPAGGAWQSGNIVFNGELSTIVPVVPGIEPNFVAVDHFPPDVNMCVYADGAPIGNFISETDANGTVVLDLGATYDTVQAGINYFSIYESFPLERPRQFRAIKTQKASITNLRMDFYETLGVNLGVSITNYSPIQFSEDDFATRQDMVTGAKIATFPRGISREPIVYLWEWLPVPWSMRAFYATLNVAGEE